MKNSGANKRNKNQKKLKNKLDNFCNLVRTRKQKRNAKKQDIYEKEIRFASKIDKILFYKTNFIRIKYNKVKDLVKKVVDNHFGYTTYIVNGLNKTKLLEILRKNVSIFNVKHNENLSFMVSSKDAKFTDKILNDYFYKYDKISSSYIHKFFSFIFNKKAFSLSVIIALFIYLFSSMFVLKIESNYYEQKVKNILLENNIKVGSKISDIDTYKLERILLKNLDISFCDIKLNGNLISINITKSSSPTISSKPDINKVVVATTDCLLFRQLIYSGEPTKKFGDIIKKGDVLVNNYITIDEKTTIPVVASGDIYGLIQKGKTIVINKNQKEKIETGKQKSITKLSFTNSFSSTKSPFTYYKSETKTGRISDLIPIYYKTTTFYELNEKLVKYDKNAVIKKYSKPVTDDLINNMPIKATYKRSFFEIEEQDNNFILSCYIEYEDKVSTLSS